MGLGFLGMLLYRKLHNCNKNMLWDLWHKPVSRRPLRAYYSIFLANSFAFACDNVKSRLEGLYQAMAVATDFLSLYVNWFLHSPVESDTEWQLAPRNRSTRRVWNPHPPRPAHLSPHYRPTPRTPFPITAPPRGLFSPLPPRPAVMASH